MPYIVVLTGSWPSNSTIQCIGRTNSSLRSDQRMRLGAGSALRASSMRCGMTSSDGLPVSRIRQASQLPLSVSS